MKRLPVLALLCILFFVLPVCVLVAAPIMEEAQSAPIVSRNEKRFTVVVLPLPENVLRVYVWRKGAYDVGKPKLIYTSKAGEKEDGKFFPAGNFVFTDYYAQPGKPYTYCYAYNRKRGDKWVSSYFSREVTARAANGYGELGIYAMLSYDEKSGLLALKEPMTIRPGLPAGWTGDLELFVQSPADVKKLPWKADGINLQKWCAKHPAFCDVPLTLYWVIRANTPDGSQYMSSAIPDYIYGKSLIDYF
ncbi:MAG: hypothetical protein K6G80_02755 [Treponema sp.]|nr:hypothetical protein [Treponema sp.]